MRLETNQDWMRKRERKTSDAVSRLCRTRRGLIWRVLGADRPGFGLLLVADRTIRMGQSYIDRLEVMSLEKRGHRRPLRRWGTTRRDVFADATHGQRLNGRHRNLPETTLTLVIFRRASN
jgi:hypothetical protein